MRQTYYQLAHWENEEKYRRAWGLWLQGLTYRAIGLRIGMCGQSAANLIKRYRRSLTLTFFANNNDSRFLYGSNWEAFMPPKWAPGKKRDIFDRVKKCA